VQFPTFANSDIQAFVAFAKILISEQISDFYNVRMMGDESLPPMVQKINRVHHEDEIRHIAMGLRVVRAMHDEIAGRHSEETRLQIESYLRRYTQFFVESFYNPSAYRDAGLDTPYEWREKLSVDPARKDFHKQVLRKTSQFFRSCNLMVEEAF
jgi:hypothetical protein